MLQHLFIEAAENSDETGRLPIMAELRNFSSRYDGFLPFIVDTVREYDDSFTENSAKEVLERGQAQILFDGLDELDPGEVKFFQKKLAELTHRYPNVQVIITSRQCSAIEGIRGFVRLYLHPLNEDQVDQLLDKLLLRKQDADEKKTVMSFFEPGTGYLRRDGFVATNPMLLTVIVSNCEKLKELNGDKSSLYEMLYDVLIRGHDEEKEAFDRFFHSVGSSEEFTQVFRAFCSLSYMDGVFEFDHRTFEKYFKDVKKQEELEKLKDGVTIAELVTKDCEVEQVLNAASNCDSNNVNFLASFDHGGTWWEYANGWITPDTTKESYGMFAPAMKEITKEQWAVKLTGSIQLKTIIHEKGTLTDIQIFTKEVEE